MIQLAIASSQYGFEQFWNGKKTSFFLVKLIAT